MYRTAIFLAAALALPALPARADTCVNVVVDDGSHTPTRHCTTASYGDTAAQVLDVRWQEVHTTPPRYKGNFLCALDGYPESGCAIDDRSAPYWAFWIWRKGTWVYSQFGVDSYAIEDSDHDGHPDPIGFRYTALDKSRTPRAGGGLPSPSPTPTPHPTTRPPAPTATGSRTPTPQPSATGSRKTPTARAVVPTRAATAPPVGSPSATVDAVEPTATATHPRRAPYGALAGLLVALGIGAAGVHRYRKSA